MISQKKIEKLYKKLKTEHHFLAKCEGMEDGNWVLIDCGDIIVHIFQQEVRDYYQLEDLWKKRVNNQN